MAAGDDGEVKEGRTSKYQGRAGVTVASDDLRRRRTVTAAAQQAPANAATATTTATSALERRLLVVWPDDGFLPASTVLAGAPQDMSELYSGPKHSAELYHCPGAVGSAVR